MAEAQAAGRWLVTGHLDGAIRVWDLVGHRNLVGRSTISDQPVSSLSAGVLRGEPCVFAACAGGDVWAWRLPDITPAGHTLPGHDPDVNLGAGLLAGHDVVVAADGQGLRVWDPARGVMLRALNATPSLMTLIEVNGRLTGATAHALAGSYADTITVFDLATGNTLAQIPAAHGEPGISALATGRSGKRFTVLSGGGPGTVRQWDLLTGLQVGDPWPQWELRGCLGSYRVYSIAIGRKDGRAVAAVGGWEGVVRIWDLDRGERVGEPLEDSIDAGEATCLGERCAGEDEYLDESVHVLAFADLDGRPCLFAGGGEPVLRVWDLPRGVVARRHLTGSPTTAMTIA